MSTSRHARTLAGQLRGWPDERLAALLEARPDLGTPTPTDSGQLASRAAVRLSVQRAMDGLDRLGLGVLTIVAQQTSIDSAGVREAAHADGAVVDAALERLADLALIWGEPDAWHPVTAVGELLGLPAGPDAARLPALLAEVDDRARALLAHLDESDAPGLVRDLRPRVTTAEATTPAEHLVARRLLVALDDRHVAIPWSVRLALRGGRSTAGRLDVVPDLAAGERDQSLVDRAAAGAAFELTRRAELLLDHWATRPPGALRGGGLGVRDLRAVATLLHTEAPLAALVVETVAAAGLLAQGMTDTDDAAWLPTDAYDAWLARPAAERWLTLARPWLDGHRLVSAVGGREGDKPVNALAPGLERAWLPSDRRTTLAELATLEPGHTLAAGTGASSLVERLRWRHPRRPEKRLALVPAYLDEAAAFGLTGLDGLSAFGRLLLDDADPTASLAGLLPAPVDHVLIQADLTAVAPGPLEQDLARRLAVVADVESRGGATVYRFTTDSVRRGFDAGWSAAELNAFLAASSRTPVPQALEFLVADVARRFGTLRAGAVASFLRSDDESALAELLHGPGAAGLRLRRIAPTVLVSDVPLDVLLPRLRELGAAPVVEAADGTVRVARPDEFRARTPKPAATPAMDTARRHARTSAVVAAIRAGDRAAAERPLRAPATTPADVVSLLRQAVEARAEVWIGYLDNHGAASERIVRPIEVGGGRLTAYDERDEDVRHFQIHRITAARVTP